MGVPLLVAPYTLGLMGILTPYATGSAPLYFSSGYFRAKRFWKLELIFGGISRRFLSPWGLPPAPGWGAVNPLGRDRTRPLLTLASEPADRDRFARPMAVAASVRSRGSN